MPFAQGQNLAIATLRVAQRIVVGKMQRVFIGQIEYLVRKFREELHAPDALVVATGGMAVIVAEEGGIIDKLDGILTLKGLRLLYERNR